MFLWITQNSFHLFYYNFSSEKTCTHVEKLYWIFQQSEIKAFLQIIFKDSWWNSHFEASNPAVERRQKKVDWKRPYVKVFVKLAVEKLFVVLYYNLWQFILNAHACFNWCWIENTYHATCKYIDVVVMI